MIYKLAILICSIESRQEQLEKLINSIPTHPDVIVIPEIDDKKITTGAKRNKLLQRAKDIGAEYISFVDDDDHIEPDYVGEIMKAIERKPDVIGFKGWMTTNGSQKTEWRISKNFPYARIGEIYYRFNNHLSPIRIDIALRIKYPNISFGEDYDYAKRLRESRLIKSEVYINKFLYHYDYKTVKK
jgi:hypothetical protein